MRFLILRSQNKMAVDNADLNLDCSALAANIEMIVWQGNAGLIEFNDRPAVRTPITDIAPYQTWLNQYMTAASALAPPIQVAQARQIKTDMVECLYFNKRRLPFNYGSWQYDGSDEAVQYMTAALTNITSSSDPTSGLVGAINTAFATLRTQINTNIVAGANSQINTNIVDGINNAVNNIVVAQVNAYVINYINATLVAIFNSNVTANNNSAAAVNTWSPQMSAVFARLQYYRNPGAGDFPSVRWDGVPPAPGTGTGVGNASSPNPGSGGFQNMSTIPGTSGISTIAISAIGIAAIAGVTVSWGGPGTTGSVSWQPLNSTVPVTISADEFNNALKGIVDRRTSLNTARMSKRTAINALSTVAAVIAFDATAGWPV